MSSKSITTLVEDIYGLFSEKPHAVSDERCEEFGRAFADVVRRRLVEDRAQHKPTLRMSNLGKPLRQLWYELKGYPKEDFSPQTKIKFLYGDILELLVLFLAKEAGHDVTHEQAEVEIDGVRGSMDARIDGVVVDVKSASSRSFEKFEKGTLVNDDPFGYIKQISGYADGEDEAAFVAIDKVMGHITTLKVAPEGNTRDIINRVRTALSRTDPPERCYSDVSDGKSGNRRLGVGCSYCAFKENCWPNLRKFVYARGPVWLTHVEREPKVFETRPESDDG